MSDEKETRPGRASSAGSTSSVGIPIAPLSLSGQQLSSQPQQQPQRPPQITTAPIPILSPASSTSSNTQSPPNPSPKSPSTLATTTTPAEDDNEIIYFADFEQLGHDFAILLGQRDHDVVFSLGNPAVFGIYLRLFSLCQKFTNPFCF